MRKDDIAIIKRKERTGFAFRRWIGGLAILVLLFFAAGYVFEFNPWALVGLEEPAGLAANGAALTGTSRADNRSITISEYPGYGRADYLFLTGRVLRRRTINESDTASLWSNIKDNYKRFASAEIPNAEVRVQWAEHTFDLTTDAEGYYHLEREFEQTVQLPEAKMWQRAEVTVVAAPGTAELPYSTYQEVLLPPENAAFGIISDIDDTVLKTDVTSRFKWRLATNTLFKNAAEREGFEYVDEFFRALRRGPDGAGTNPVFYVSNSPWNLYDLLTDFLDNNGLPKGPILLRDFGRSYRETPADYRGHKTERVAQILSTYPELPFVLIGDSGEKDTDIYLEMAMEYPERIEAIYIRDVLNTKRAERIEGLIEANSDIPVDLFDSYAAAQERARERGLIQ